MKIREASGYESLMNLSRTKQCRLNNILVLDGEAVVNVANVVNLVNVVSVLNPVVIIALVEVVSDIKYMRRL